MAASISAWVMPPPLFCFFGAVLPPEPPLLPWEPPLLLFGGFAAGLVVETTLCATYFSAPILYQVVPETSWPLTCSRYFSEPTTP